MSPCRSFRRGLFGALCALAVAPGPLAAADIQGFIEMCDEGKMCGWWHKAKVTPPAGWVENEEWTRRYKAMFMFPDGENDASKPVMYVRTHHGDAALGIDEYVEVAQARWKNTLPDSSIEPLADLVRDGKPGFKVYLYRNPSQPEQAYELTAFMKDVDAAHPNENYFFQVVLSAPSMAEIEKAKPAFYALLRAL